jgi:hypothetical protein
MKTFCLNRGKFNEGNKIVPLSRFPIHARNDFWQRLLSSLSQWVYNVTGY